MSGTWTRLRGVVVVGALVLVAAVLLPLLRSNAADRQHAWEVDCARRGAAVTTEPQPAQRNPLVVETGHVVAECRAADGTVLSRRD